MRNRIAWFGCWACYRLYLLMPINWRISTAILPYAGSYAYQTFAQFCERRAELRAKP